jgi:hypothetical protein
MGIAKSEGIDGIVGLCDKAVVPVADLTEACLFREMILKVLKSFFPKITSIGYKRKQLNFSLHVITETAEEAEEKSRDLHLKVLFVKQDTFFLFTTFIVFFD